jgi:hypothetical protein
MNLGYDVIPVRKVASGEATMCAGCGRPLDQTTLGGGDTQYCPDCKAKTSSRKLAQETGYFVVSRNGSHLSGPYATFSEAAPFMIEQRGATVQFQGPGDDTEWAVTKAKQFPQGFNTVNG